MLYDVEGNKTSRGALQNKKRLLHGPTRLLHGPTSDDLAATLVEIGAILYMATAMGRINGVIWPHKQTLNAA